jgi:hypothetical protein
VARTIATPSRHPEMARQSGNPGGDGQHDRSPRPRPWPFRARPWASPRSSVARSASVRRLHGPRNPAPTDA